MQLISVSTASQLKWEGQDLYFKEGKGNISFHHQAHVLLFFVSSRADVCAAGSSSRSPRSNIKVLMSEQCCAGADPAYMCGSLSCVRVFIPKDIVDLLQHFKQK